jgi:hypothetical protein
MALVASFSIVGSLTFSMSGNRNDSPRRQGANRFVAGRVNRWLASYLTS